MKNTFTHEDFDNIYKLTYHNRHSGKFYLRLKYKRHCFFSKYYVKAAIYDTESGYDIISARGTTNDTAIYKLKQIASKNDDRNNT